MDITNSRYLSALSGLAHDCTPVWIMRQAGRYLPEYRQIRQSVGSFMQLCQSPELACEVTLQPIKRFDFDAAILFSDILTIPEAMGLGLSFVTGQGPVFDKTIRSEKDFSQVRDYETSEALHYVFEAVKLIKQRLPEDKPLIGFSGSPWTLATYMVEGGSSKQFTVIRNLLYKNPDLLERIILFNEKKVVEYLVGQAKAGAGALMIFDTWGGILPQQLFLKYSLASMKRIIQAIKQVCPHIPVTLYTKGSGLWLKDMASSGTQALGLDWAMDLTSARKCVGESVSLQGNLDPAVLYAAPEKVEQEVIRVLQEYGQGYRHIFNLGHGIFPDVHPESVHALVEAVRKHGKKT